MDKTQNFTHQFHKIVHLMQKRMGQVLAENGSELTFSQFRILLCISKIPNACQADIAKWNEITPAAISRQMGILQKLGLVSERENKTGGRQNIFVLTKKGERELEQFMTLFSSSFENMYALLSATERNALSSALPKLILALQKDIQQ